MLMTKVINAALGGRVVQDADKVCTGRTPLQNERHEQRRCQTAKAKKCSWSRLEHHDKCSRSHRRASPPTQTLNGHAIGEKRPQLAWPPAPLAEPAGVAGAAAVVAALAEPTSADVAGAATAAMGAPAAVPALAKPATIIADGAAAGVAPLNDPAPGVDKVGAAAASVGATEGAGAAVGLCANCATPGPARAAAGAGAFDLPFSVGRTRPTMPTLLALAAGRREAADLAANSACLSVICTSGTRSERRTMLATTSFCDEWESLDGMRSKACSAVPSHVNFT